MNNRNHDYGKGDFRSTLGDNMAGVRVVAAGLMVVLLITAVFASYATAQKQVTLQVDEERVEVGSFAGTVGDLLSEENVEMGALDRVFPLSGTPLEDGMTVTVRHAVPVTLQVGRDESHFHTAAETVGDVLKERKVTLGELDVISPSMKTRLKPGTTIKVDRITVSSVEEETPIQFNVRRESDNTLARGITSVVQRGVEGLERKTWEVTYKNGEKTGRRLVASAVLREPVDQVVKVGALQIASRGGQKFRFSRAYEMTATAYTHTGYNTATGVKPRVGIVAVDPSVIRLGARLFVDGYGYCRAMDVGSKIKGNRIDVFFDSQSAARKWGVRKIKVYVLE